MSISERRKDYSLLSEKSVKAVEEGLSGAEWYTPPVPRKTLKELMKRKDGPAIRDTFIWISLLIISGAAGVALWGTYWAIIPFIFYGVLYGSASDSRWHECGHGTAFKTPWMNNVVYQVASFMTLREPTVWRWTHTRHHTDTIIVGRDPEISSVRPPEFLKMFLNIFNINNGFNAIISVIRHAFGSMTDEERSFVPEMEWKKVFVVARVWVLVFSAIITACALTHSILPAVLIGLPSLYGAFYITIFGYTQHAGLAEDVTDHRLNTRTVYMNRMHRFMYWNMNYHLEHHIFPMIPYHALPTLHEEIKKYSPKPYHGLISAWKEIIPTLIRQRKDPAYHIVQKIPDEYASFENVKFTKS
ncbi:fatty acid desaturase family protein [Pantoea agglomerans]|uniref:fatty acid desaturase family protein n=1 Tax=Enterobacter agglomerans TaxID=549 RepID=UPI001303A2A6|nr:fatty acid desaturase family protein [Pantoea agglomerans]